VRDERDDMNRAAHARGERFCVRVEWMPARQVTRDWLKRPDSFALSSDIPEPVTVYVPVAVIEANDDGVLVGPYLNSRPLALPWRDLLPVSQATRADPETLRQVVARWGLL